MDTKTQQQYAETFHGLHKRGDPLILFNAWDVATAKAIAKTFPAVATSSGAVASALGGEPADVVAVADAYAKWLSQSPIPKLFIDADPAGFLIGAQREFCRAWPNQHTVTVKGAHFLQEEVPDEVGEATAKFVSKVLARQIS